MMMVLMTYVGEGASPATAVMLLAMLAVLCGIAALLTAVFTNAPLRRLRFEKFGILDSMAVHEAPSYS